MASLSAGRSSESRAIGAARLAAKDQRLDVVLGMHYSHRLHIALPVPAFYPLQAAGNTLLACLLLFVGLGYKLRGCRA
jgi:hypothetical protein